MRILNQIVLAGTASLSLLLLAGCVTEDNYTPSPDVAKYQHELKNVILDDALDNVMKVEYVRRWNTENGLSNIAIRARVRTSTPWEWVFCAYRNISIAYRFAWYDEKGVEVPSKTTPKWFTLDVEYDEEVGFISVAPDIKAKDFKLFVKRLNKENVEKFKAAQPAVKKEAGMITKAEEKARSEKRVTVAKDVKVPPSTPTAPVKTAPVKTAPKNDEAEADAAAVRQATPAKPAGTKDNVKK